MRYTNGHRAGTEVRLGDLVEVTRTTTIASAFTDQPAVTTFRTVVGVVTEADYEDELTLAPGWRSWDEHGPTGRRTGRPRTVAIGDGHTVLHGSDPKTIYAQDWCLEAEDAADDACERAEEILDRVQRERSDLRAWADERFDLANP